jgi:hypothetical protein
MREFVHRETARIYLKNSSDLNAEFDTNSLVFFLVYEAAESDLDCIIGCIEFATFYW